MDGKASDELNSKELMRRVDSILKKYATPGKLEGELAVNASGVEVLLNPTDGEILYRVVTWDDIEICSRLTHRELAADPLGYLEEWDGAIKRDLELHRKQRAQRAIEVMV